MKLIVRAVPNAKVSSILGWEEDPVVGRVLKVRIGAPAVDGKANAELVSFLAGVLRVPKSKITVEKGGTARFKQLSIPDGTALP